MIDNLAATRQTRIAIDNRMLMLFSALECSEWIGSRIKYLTKAQLDPDAGSLPTRSAFSFQQPSCDILVDV